MAFIDHKTLVSTVALLFVAALAFAGFVWSGVYDVGADDAHIAPVHATLEVLRDRSIAVRADDIAVPDLDDSERITQGAGNYAAMCVGCHLAPGVASTELSRGLNPAPPDLTRQAVDAARAFWVVKHGIKASGMPAWGESMDDAYIWNLVAFQQALPGMDADQYRALVASSEGHSHGGGETTPHPQGPRTAGTGPGSDAAPAMVEHRHADGTVESHPVDAVEQPAGPTDDGHDHEH